MKKKQARFWLTRPQEYAARTAEALAGLGYESVIYPLLRYRLLEAPKIAMADGDVIIFTSSFAVEAFSGSYNIPRARVFCVGDSTAAAARAVGFGDVVSANGDVGDVIRLVVGGVDRDRGCRLWHFAARETVGDLVGELSGLGFAAELVILYETLAVGGLSDEVCDMLRGGGIDGVLLYSPKTARVFIDLVGRHGLGGDLGGISCFCLSGGIVDVVGCYDWGYVGVSGEPNEASLLELIGERY